MVRVALLVAAVQGQDPTVAHFYEVARAVVAFAQQKTGEVQGRPLGRRATLVNLRTLAALGSSATRVELRERDVAAALGIPAVSTTASQVIDCTAPSQRQGCRIRDDGIHIDFNGLLWLGSGVEVIVTIEWTQPGPPRGDHIGMSVHRLTLTKTNEQWVIQRDVVEAQT